MHCCSKMRRNLAVREDTNRRSKSDGSSSTGGKHRLHRLPHNVKAKRLGKGCLNRLSGRMINTGSAIELRASLPVCLRLSHLLSALNARVERACTVVSGDFGAVQHNLLSKGKSLRTLSSWYTCTPENICKAWYFICVHPYAVSAYSQRMGCWRRVCTRV